MRMTLTHAQTNLLQLWAKVVKTLWTVAVWTSCGMRSRSQATMAKPQVRSQSGRRQVWRSVSAQRELLPRLLTDLRCRLWRRRTGEGRVRDLQVAGYC